MKDHHQEKPSLPQSPTRLWISVVSLGITVAVFLALERFPQLSIMQITVACVLTLAASVVGLEMWVLRSHRRPSTGLDFSLKRTRDWGSIGLRLVGFYGTILLIAGLYWLLEEYYRPKFIFYFKMLAYTVPPLCIGAAAYFVWLDRYLVDTRDSYWHMGSWLMGRWARADRNVVRQHLLAWLVKGFFLPLMFLGLASQVKYFLESDLNLAQPEQWYLVGHHFIFGFDLLFSATGYLFTLRLFDSHVRSTEPTLLGWAVALFCYEPFFDFFSGQYLPYDNDVYWSVWLQGSPGLYAVWGGIILFLYGIYVIATLCFGIRFSNLTHRGILTNGPYRYCKHPAYVSKNLAWWLATIPFLSGDTPVQSLRFCLMMVCINTIYFLRARTEERHLSRDSVYVQYANAMNERSIFSGLGKLFPGLRYRAPGEK